ncbi:MAG: hypothetical protein ACK56I_23340 [bacterium]
MYRRLQYDGIATQFQISCPSVVGLWRLLGIYLIDGALHRVGSERPLLSPPSMVSIR